MTRQEYIDKVKVKLDEVSPFDEPLTFIAANGDDSYDKVKPITKYIDEELNNATEYCLRMLPLKVLASDIEKEELSLTNTNGVGIVQFADTYRLCRVSVVDWERDATHSFTTEDAEYLLQQNKHTRSGIAKPAVFFNPEDSTLELYSLPADSKTDKATIYRIDLTTKAEQVQSNISDFIALKCAHLVLDILGNQNSALMEKELERKISAL
jgi:hypothetical protein